MSEENEALDESDGIKNLRKQYEAIKKQNDELASSLGKYQAQERQSSVANILKAKGVPASAAKLYHGDDVSEDAVGKWLEEYADVFSIPGESNDANAQSAQRVSAASFGNADSVANGPKGQAILGNPDEIARLLATGSDEELIRLGYMPTPGTLFNPKR